MPSRHRTVLPAACAATLEAVFALRVGRGVDLVRLAAALELEVAAALDAVAEAETAFQAVFGIRLMPRERPWFADKGEDDGDVAGPDVGEIRLSAAMAEILDMAPILAPVGEDAPGVDGATATWVSALGSRPVEDAGALHLALRTGRDAMRAATDLAGLLRDVGVPAFWIGERTDGLAAELLRVEMHRRDPRGVVLIASGLANSESSWDDLAEGKEEADAASSFALGAKWLRAVRTPCIWCVPHDHTVPASLGWLVAGALGPIRPAAGWAAGTVREAIGAGVGDAGVAAIAATLGDPRDAPARGRAVRMLAATGMEVDAACRFVASSLVAASPDRPSPSVPFDPGLVAYDPEIALMLSRAREIAQASGRILLVGKVGGGKSHLLSALAAGMEASGAAGPPIHLSAGKILVKAYGGTERILERLWSEAALARSPLVIDEIDALCGVRDPGSAGGNAYLVRVLTDEFLRLFDAHPQVVVLASGNDRSAIDPGVLRRFHVELVVADELPPHLERRAWDTLLGVQPPPRWTPCGASPSDFAAARTRCRMLGIYDPASLAQAIERARDARRGARSPGPAYDGSGPLKVSPGARPKVEILIAACEGSMRLACATGLPIVHIDAVADAPAALARLDAMAHGSGVRVDEPVHPIEIASGWDGWKPFPLLEFGFAASAPGVVVAGGRMSVVLPRHVPLAEFREQLHGALRHLRLQDVGGDVGYLRLRSAAAAHRAVHPRYTPSRQADGATLVTDLYCVDPTWQTWRLFWIVVAARLAAQEGRRPRWA